MFMARILVVMSLAAVTLAAKDRAWQTGQLLDKGLNPYFKTVDSDSGNAKSNSEAVVFGIPVAVNVHHSSGDVVYDDYVIEGDDTVYMVEATRFKNTKQAHLSLSRPLSYAVEKNKLFIKDLDKDEYETVILKQAPKRGAAPGTTVASTEVKPAPAAATQDSAPAKPAPAPAPAKAAPAKPAPKPDPFALASAQAPAQATPSPAVAQPVTQPQPAAPPQPVAKQQAPAPAPKPAPKVEAAVTKPVEKPAPVAKPESSTVVRASAKDRAWQSGQLLSVVNNSYFFNVTYSSDSEGGSWPFAQGSDGRYTVNGQIGVPTNSPYTYDNYVIESQFVVYLVQRMRPKTSPPVRLPGSAALKFAVEKNKLWVLDDQNVEYETKVLKLVQKDAIVDPLTRAAAR
jgi:hypothetical protein